MDNSVKTTLFLILVAVVAYLLGGANGAIITSINFLKKDVRNYGSGNAGLTNFYRTFGAQSMVFVILLDAVKTILSVSFGRWIMGLLGYPVIGILFAGLCTMLGHIYPPFYSFRGGKGILCSGVIVWMLDWRVGLICCSVFLILVIFTKYVSLGSLLGALCFPAAVWIFGYQGLDIILALICALLVIFAHRENIVRLIRGTESKLSIGSTRHT